MAHNMLNDRSVKAAKPKDGKAVTLNDGGGLILYVHPTANKQWIFRYTFNGKRKKTTFGSYPAVRLNDARSKRDDYLHLLNQGIDPIAHFKQIKAEQKQSEERKHNPETTIGFLIDKFLALKEQNEGLKEITTRKATSRAEKHIYPYLPDGKNSQIDTLEYDIIISMLQTVEESGKLETLGRLRNLLIGVLKFAYAENVYHNADLITKLEAKTFQRVHKSNVRNAPTLTKRSDIKELMLAIDTYPGEILTKYATLLSIHTAQRQGSIISAKWEEIDLDKKRWIIPAEKMKMKKRHIVPLADQTVAMLKDLQTYTGADGFLFPNTQHRKRHMSENTVNAAMRRMGFSQEKIVAHGFRAMFSTIAREETNFGHELIESQLAHAVGNEVSQAYNRADYIEKRAELMQWWADYLDNL